MGHRGFIRFYMFVGLLLGSNTLEANNCSVRDQSDSLYNLLSTEQRIGLLLDLNIHVDQSNIDQYAEVIRSKHIGSVTIHGGEPSALLGLLIRVSEGRQLPLRVTVGDLRHLGLPLDSLPTFPSALTVSNIRDSSLVYDLVSELSYQMNCLGINGYRNGLFALTASEVDITASGYDVYENKNGGLQLFQERLHRGGTELIIDLSIKAGLSDPEDPMDVRRKFRAGLTGSATGLEKWVKESEIYPTTISISQMPYFTVEEALAFRKRFFNILVNRQLEHSGLVEANLESIFRNLHWRNDSNAVVTLLNTGVHILSAGSDIPKMATYISRALQSGQIDEKDFRLKVESVIASRLGERTRPVAPPQPDGAVQLIYRAEPAIINRNIYKHTLKLIRADPDILPLDHTRYPYLASLDIGIPQSDTFEKMLDRYALVTHFHMPYFSYDPYQLESLKGRLIQYDVVIISLQTDEFTSIDQRILEFIGDLGSRVKIMLVLMGSEDKTDNFKDIPVLMEVAESNDDTETLIPQVIFGAMDYPLQLQRHLKQPMGTDYANSDKRFKMSFGLPEEEEMDSRTLSRIDGIVRESISMGATPGCQVLVARNGSVVFDKNYGYYTYDSIIPVNSNTMYDLASITKVMATTQILMMLHDRGLFDLDEKLIKYLPELGGTNKEGMVIRDILAHQAGLRPFYPFWKNTVESDDENKEYYHSSPSEQYSLEVALGMFGDKSLQDSIWRWTMNTRLLRMRRNGSYEYKYSDLGFYLMQRLIEKLASRPIDFVADSLIFQPLGLSRLTYNPLCRFPQADITPTELDEDFRHVLVWGTVHDQIAAMNGGTGGHAGLFGNASDLAQLLIMNLQDGVYNGVRYISEETLKVFTASQFNNNRRGLGWDKPERRETLNPVSRYASESSYGHRGFTGTIVWADPTFNLVYVFLSNRIHPNARNTKLIDYNVRKRIQDVVYESIWNFEKYYKE